MKLVEPSDLYDTTDRPKAADLDALPEARQGALAAIGSAYLEKRPAKFQGR